MERRKLRPLNLSPERKELTSGDPSSPLHKPNNISLDSSGVISSKIINLPLKQSRKDKLTKFKLK